MSTIINLAQNFVGSNNMNLLLPIGQFGTRLHGGKDANTDCFIKVENYDIIERGETI
jgi:DNA topoisomerase-2